jgi:uridine phosphorylase
VTLDRRYFHDLFGGEAGPGSIAPFAILVNDPLKVLLLSEELGGVTPVADHYEFLVVTGSWQGLRLSVCSTGIGGGSATIAIDNLARLGAQTMIYVDAGPSHIGQPGFWAATGAVRQDGASLDYAPPEFPAAADVEVLMAVQAAAQELALPVEPALFWASAGLISPEKSSSIESYLADQMAANGPYQIPLVVTPPESATILTLGTLYRLRAGAVYAGLMDPAKADNTLRQVFLLALSSLRFLQAWDADRVRAGWKLMTPPIRMN